MGKKKFIDKKNSATYRLVFKESSSVTGEGGLGEGADRVFVRVDGGDAHVPGFDPDTDDDEEDNGGREEDGRGFRRRGAFENARLELLELGFPDDGYDYLQHLREVGPSGRIGSFVPTNHARLDPLRPDVKAYDASNVRVRSSANEDDNEINALIVSRSTHRIKGPASKVIDLDVAALLDKDDNESLTSVDELEDDFIAMANEGAESFALEESGSEIDDSKPSELINKEQLVEVEDFDNFEDGDEQHERRARFLDEQFELLALREYDDDDIGELDHDDLSARGTSHISKFNNVMSDFLINSTFVQDKYHTPAEIKSSLMGNEQAGPAELTWRVEKAQENDSLFMPSVDKSRIQALGMLDQGVSSDEERELILDSDTDDDQGQWDCETVVSTYSNLDNHPGKICSFPIAPSKNTRLVEDSKPVIRLRGKQQLPVDYLPKRNSHEDEKNRNSIRKHHSTDAQLTKARSRTDETKEEKKTRKAAVKEDRRAARALKKDMKLMFKDESQRAQRTAAFTGPATVHL